MNCNSSNHGPVAVKQAPGLIALGIATMFLSLAALADGKPLDEEPLAVLNYAGTLEEGVTLGQWAESDNGHGYQFYCASLAAGSTVSLELVGSSAAALADLVVIPGLLKAHEPLDLGQAILQAESKLEPHTGPEVEPEPTLVWPRIEFVPESSGIYTIGVGQQVGAEHGAGFGLVSSGLSAAPEKCQSVIQSLPELSYQSELLPNYFGPNDWFVLHQVSNAGEFAAANLSFQMQAPTSHEVVGGYALAPGCLVSDDGEFLCDVANIDPWACATDGPLLLCQLPFLPADGVASLVVHLQGSQSPDLDELAIELSSSTAPGALVRIIEADNPSGLCPIQGAARQSWTWFDEGSGGGSYLPLWINQPLLLPVPWSIATIDLVEMEIADALPGLDAAGELVYTTSSSVEGSINTSLPGYLDLTYAWLELYEFPDFGIAELSFFVDAREPVISSAESMLLVSLTRAESIRDFYFNRVLGDLSFNTLGSTSECSASLVRDASHDIVEAAVEVLEGGRLAFSMILDDELPFSPGYGQGYVPAYTWTIDLGGTHDGEHGDVVIGVRFSPSSGQWEGFIAPDVAGSVLRNASSFGDVELGLDRLMLTADAESLGLVEGSTWRAGTIQSAGDLSSEVLEIFDIEGAMAPPAGQPWALLPYP